MTWHLDDREDESFGIDQRQRGPGWWDLMVVAVSSIAQFLLTQDPSIRETHAGWGGGPTGIISQARKLCVTCLRLGFWRVTGWELDLVRGLVGL